LSSEFRQHSNSVSATLLFKTTHCRTSKDIGNSLPLHSPQQLDRHRIHLFLARIQHKHHKVRDAARIERLAQRPRPHRHPRHALPPALDVRHLVTTPSLQPIRITVAGGAQQPRGGQSCVGVGGEGHDGDDARRGGDAGGDGREDGALLAPRRRGAQALLAGLVAARELAEDGLVRGLADRTRGEGGNLAYVLC
jgi:hypothetical protein